MGLQSVADVSFSSAAAAMGGAALLNTIAATRATGANGRTSNGYAAMVNAVAFVHYLYMRNRRSLGIKDVTAVRYSDWFITTPLMLAEISSLWKSDIGTGSYGLAVTANLLMLACGFHAQQLRLKGANWRPYWAGGAALLIVLFGAMSKQHSEAKADKEQKKAGSVFLGIWALYGLAFLLEGEARETAYSVLDIIAKGGLGVYVGAKVLDKDEETCVAVCPPKGAGRRLFGSSA